jgi:hypothetical protein
VADTPTRYEYQQRRDALARQVLDRYREGADLPTIAAELEITPRRASSLFAHAVAELPALDVDALRGSIEIRLDKLAQEARDLAADPDAKLSERINALNAAARIESQRAQLLGLNIKPGI